MRRMDERKVRERKQEKAASPTVEIPPQANRKHLTEPTWVENMIYLAGVLLRGEAPEEEAEEKKSSKTEAA